VRAGPDDACCPTERFGIPRGLRACVDAIFVTPRRNSGEQVPEHAGLLDTGQPYVEHLEADREPLVVEPQLG